jgi:hypothetical protein
MAEKFFFNTFGYLQLPIAKNDIIDIFEEEIANAFNLDSHNKLAYENLNGRYSGLRHHCFKNDEIQKIFYNNDVLNTLKTIMDDFIILSPMESFYLNQSSIHRDFCGEINTTKILFYLDDVSDVNKGPLYVIPGTQFIYDKYSSCIGNNVSWPPGIRNNVGSGYNLYHDYLTENIPKKYLLSNKDSILFFNNTMLHGSDGDRVEHRKLRRAIGMTVIFVDRNNKELMDSVNELYKFFKIKNKNNLSYLYCEKNKEISGDWLDHFYEYSGDEIECELNGNTDPDGTKRSNLINRFKSYTDHLEKVNNEITNISPYNCYLNQITNYSI